MASNNGTKSTTVLQAATTDPTNIRRASLPQDRKYRLAVAWQNTACNQPPHASFLNL